MPPDERSRRQFLKRAGTVALAAGLAGCGSDDDDDRTPTPRPTPDRDETPTATETPSETETAPPTPTETSTPVPEIVRRFGDRFGSIVDLTEAGADAAGDQRIDDVLADAVADDTLLYFPSGEYKLGPVRLENCSNVGLVSLPGEDVTITPAVQAGEMNHRFMEITGASDLLIDGITLDFEGTRRGGAVHVAATDDFVVRNVRVRGKIPDRLLSANAVAFRFEAVEQSASGVVENVVATDGGHEGGNAVGIYVGKDHAGELTFRDCRIEGFPNNGLYASAPGRQLDGFTGADGAVHVRGGRYANNNIANVRLGSTGSTARGVEIVVDRTPPVPEDSSLNVRGLRLRGRSGQVVENCTIRIGSEAGKGFGALVVHPDNGAATVRNTEISVDRDDYRAINALPAAGDGDAGPTFENVTVTGSAGGGEAVAVSGRDGTTLSGCVVEQSGDGRAGLVFSESADCVVADSTIRVTGDPIRVEDASVERRNITTESWNA
jgi:hypothetical protein